MSQIAIAEFNPNNLPIEKIGKCENPNHEEWMGEEPTNDDKLSLIMLYSNEYVENWCDCSQKHKLTDEEFDKKYDKYEKVKWLQGSEAYYCEGCRESLDPC